MVLDEETMISWYVLHCKYPSPHNHILISFACGWSKQFHKGNEDGERHADGTGDTSAELCYRRGMLGIILRAVTSGQIDTERGEIESLWI